MKAKQLQGFAWGTAGVSVLLGVVVWGGSFSWDFGNLNTYLLFPLFGLIAFSLMWSHYVTAAVRQYFQLDKKVVHDYFEITSTVVLGAILLHPGLLAFQLWADGMGLPPSSELHYLPSSKEFYILLAMISLCIFLAYELRRFYAKKPWWRYVQIASDFAIIAVYIHALNVGSQLQAGWFQVIWYLYGLTLAASLSYIYVQKAKPKPKIQAK
jgi:hypothetical protein